MRLCLHRRRKEALYWQVLFIVVKKARLEADCDRDLM